MGAKNINLLWKLGECIYSCALKTVIAFFEESVHSLIFEDSVHSSSGAIGGMTVVTAVMKEDASMNRVNSTSLLVRMGAAFPKPTSVMGIMTVVMNLMSWNISVVHQKQPAPPIILNVTMETALSWLKSAIVWMIA